MSFFCTWYDQSSFLLCFSIITAVIQEVADHQRQLDALPNERDCRQEEERLAAEVQGMEKAAEYHDLDMKATLEKQQKTDAEVSGPAFACIVFKLSCAPYLVLLALQ